MTSEIHVTLALFNFWEGNGFVSLWPSDIIWALSRFATLWEYDDRSQKTWLRLTSFMFDTRNFMYQ
jgi:hypothetical protein